MKKAIISNRTYKQYNSPSVLYRKILRRIVSDKAALTSIKFQQKWQGYSQLTCQSELYINAFTLWTAKGVLRFVSVYEFCDVYICKHVLCIFSYVKMNKYSKKKLYKSYFLSLDLVNFTFFEKLSFFRDWLANSLDAWKNRGAWLQMLFNTHIYVIFLTKMASYRMKFKIDFYMFSMPLIEIQHTRLRYLSNM